MKDSEIVARSPDPTLSQGKLICAVNQVEFVGLAHTPVTVEPRKIKGTEVPNPWRSSTCDCTCVLTRIDHCLMTLSCLPCAFCFVPAYAKVRSQISDILSQALCNFL